MKNNSNRICYVCGFDFDTEPENERQEWPFIFCPCCGFEYGIDDLEFNCFTTWRQKWIENGLNFGYKLKPQNYNWNINDVLKQLNNLKLVNVENYYWGKEMNPNYTIEVDIEEVKNKWEEFRN